MRVTFNRVLQSRLPTSLGLCDGDRTRIMSYVNEAQQRLINAGGETGWYGGWYRTVFNVSSDGEIALDRYIARVINVSVCNVPVSIENGFYEFMEAGVGPQSEDACYPNCNRLELIDRGMHPTQVDISGDNKRCRVYASDARDYGQKVMFSGKDNNNRIVRTLYNGSDYNGAMAVLASPFSDAVPVFSEITGIQKELTVGDVLVYEFDIITGDENLLAVLDAREEVPSYRRYFVNNFTGTCCGTTPQVQGMAKLEYVPVERASDFLVIGNIPALKEECESIRYSEMDSPDSMAMAEIKHKRAIKLLQQELAHYMGRQRPAINVPLWGTATLDTYGVGTLI